MKIQIEVTEDELQMILVGLTSRILSLEANIRRFPRDSETMPYWLEQKKLADNLYWDLMPNFAQARK